MPPRTQAPACILAAVVALGGSALAQDDGAPAAAPIVVNIKGACTLTVADDTPCLGVAYMVFPSNGRINFTAITQTAGWAFSGEEDDNSDGEYTLEIDSVVTPAGGRLEADGECTMQTEADHRTVKILACAAETEDGDLLLKASGVITDE